MPDKYTMIIDNDVQLLIFICMVSIDHALVIVNIDMGNMT